LVKLRKQVQEELPGQDIQVSLQNDTVFLRGTAKNLISSDRAATIAGTAGKVVNLLYSEIPPTDSQILLKVQFATVDRSNTTDLGMSLFSTGATNTLGRMTTGQFGGPSVTPATNGPTTFTVGDARTFFIFRPDLNLRATTRT